MGSSDFTSTIRILASRWADAGLLLPAFPLLARGQPLGVDEIAEASGVNGDRVLQVLENARCERDDDGRLIDLFGMTLSPTLHRFPIDGRILFSCCALWAHVIPKLVGRLIEVESVDPSSRELVQLSLSPDGIEGASPAGAAATMAIASPEAVDADVCAAFCCHVRHFVSLASAERFAARSRARHVVDLVTLDNMADQLHQEIRRTSRVG